MDSNKISEFYRGLEQGGNITPTLRENIKNIKSEDDLRKIIEDEIIPLAQKMGLNFTSDELMDYEKQIGKTLSDAELENISGGIDGNYFKLGLISLIILGLRRQ